MKKRNIWDRCQCCSVSKCGNIGVNRVSMKIWKIKKKKKKITTAGGMWFRNRNGKGRSQKTAFKMALKFMKGWHSLILTTWDDWNVCLKRLWFCCWNLFKVTITVLWNAKYWRGFQVSYACSVAFFRRRT